MTFDKVITDIGAFGPFQRRLVALGLFPFLLYAFQCMVPVFILTEHTHTCQSHFATPTNLSSHVSSAPPSACQVRQYDDVTNTSTETHCTAWTYDTTEHTSTPISDFDLVCGSAMLKSHINMAFYFGFLVCSLVVAAVGDSCGRKPTACAILVFLCFSIGCTWAPNVYVFAVLRFLTGVGCNPSQIKILVVEMVGPEWRSFTAVAHDLTFSVGEMLLSVLAYYIRDWRTLQLVLSVPSVVCLLYGFVLPESVRWQHASGKPDKAMNSLRRMSNTNSLPLPETLKISLEVNNTRAQFWSLVKSRTLLLRWLANLFSWFASAVLFYGLSLNVGILGGNVYLNFVICAVTEVVGLLGGLQVSNRLGRKVVIVTIFCMACVLSGVSVFTTICIDGPAGYWVVVTTAILGRMCGIAGMSVIFTYTSELFPTSLRSFVVSVGNTSNMVGGMAAPYIAYMGEFIPLSYGRALPGIIYGCMALVAGLLALTQPETLNRELPQIINDLHWSTKDKDTCELREDTSDTVWSTRL